MNGRYNNKGSFRKVSSPDSLNTLRFPRATLKPPLGITNGDSPFSLIPVASMCIQTAQYF